MFADWLRRRKPAPVKKPYCPAIELLETREAPAAQLSSPAGMTFTDAGVLFVASRGNGIIMRFDAAGVPSPRSGYAGATFVAPGMNYSPKMPP